MQLVTSMCLFLAKYQFKLVFLQKGQRACLIAGEAGEQRGQEEEVRFRG
jgi:hypothetical protein